MISIEVKSFSAITKDELYEILQLRSEVFVVEQNCIYQDIDYKDQKALHILGKKEGKLVAYTRVFNSGDYFDNPSISRVVVKTKERKFGYGHTIMKASIKSIYKHFEKQDIEISAQCYLKEFYNLHGFFQTSKEYLEDGIPHIRMIKS